MNKVFIYLLTFPLCIIFICNTSCNKRLNQNGSNTPIPPILPRFAAMLHPKDTFTENLDTLLFFKRSACFGFCPAYEYVIYTNGLVYYKGYQHAHPSGRNLALISENEWQEIMMRAKSFNFFELSDVYPAEKEFYIPDLPNTITLIKDAGLRKQVIDNHSCPKELKQFEIFLEEKIKVFSFKTDWSNSEK
jgi:Domain of unknown function (DUF6438)